MGSDFQTPITIKDAVDRIHNRYYLLPAIQRKFTWNSSQIEMLFDSILQGYPINSFMMWKISDSKIKNNYKFYGFLTKFKERFSEDNEEVATNGCSDFEAVIDGQQRLSSLYIGLRGSYAYKMPRKWWYEDEKNLPTRRLYLNLSAPVKQQYDNQKIYDFRFLSKDDLLTFKKNQTEDVWFEVGTILNLSSIAELNKYIRENKLENNSYACETLEKLYECVRVKKTINYYLLNFCS